MGDKIQNSRWPWSNDDDDDNNNNPIIGFFICPHTIYRKYGNRKMFKLVSDLKMSVSTHVSFFNLLHIQRCLRKLSGYPFQMRFNSYLTPWKRQAYLENHIRALFFLWTLLCISLFWYMHEDCFGVGCDDGCRWH